MKAICEDQETTIISVINLVGKGLRVGGAYWATSVFQEQISETGPRGDVIVIPIHLR
jgi:hypothetical protein